MKTSIRSTGIALLLFLTGSSFAISEAQPIIRASLGTQGRIWAGQQVTLVVELLVPGYFSGTPFYDLPQIPRTLILPPSKPPVVSSEQVGETTYTAQRYEFFIIPHRSGNIEISPFDIRFDFKRNALDHDSISVTGKTPAVHFLTEQPPGASPGENLITSADLTVTETWAPIPASNAKAGDAFVRTITWSASDVPGMAFPAFEPTAITGLGVYSTSPEISEQNDRSGSRRQRIDHITYLCKSGGHVVIPAMDLSWWNPDQMEMQHVILSSRTFDIAAAPVKPATAKETVENFFHHHALKLAWTAAALSMAIIFLRLTRRSWSRFFHRLLPRHLAPLNPP